LLDVTDGTHSVSVELPTGASELKLLGYDNDELVAGRKIQI